MNVIGNSSFSGKKNNYFKLTLKKYEKRAKKQTKNEKH
jgi:hypothetical protein